MKRKILVMNQKDNVGVLLEKAVAGDNCNYRNHQIDILNDIDFAHKVALTDISANEWIIKYGHEIGHAEKNIRKGEWVHTHNMGCRRGN
jgi:hypothetical protein